MNYILELKLNTLLLDEDSLKRTFNVAKKLYNISLSHYLKQYRQLKNNKYHKKCIKKYFYYKQLIAENKDKTVLKQYTKELNFYKKDLNGLIKQFELTEYSGHSFIKTHKHYYSKYIDINTAQKISSRAYKAIKELLFNTNTKKVKLKKELFSVEGKNNKSGIRFKNNYLCWNKLKIPAVIRPNDLYAQECLATGEIKYSRIVKKFIKNKYKYYVQLVMEGEKPPKRNKDGSFKQKYGSDTIGIDTSMQFIALCSDSKVKFYELGQNINSIEKELAKYKLKLDRQYRANNPNKYNKDGTIKKGNKKKWLKSNQMLKTLNEIKHLYSKRKRILKQSHELLANEILTIGTDIYIEKINYSELKQRSKETKTTKRGKFKSKKRYGKSIQNKAPAMFLEILNKKLSYIGKTLKEINIYTFKSSQYNHYTDCYNKKTLNER